MAYSVKEIFYSLQGEGANTGKPAVFLRFAGCNLWSGREQDRAQAVCKFCDTDFVGGQQYPTADSLADAVSRSWRGNGGAQRFVVCTGGEPLLQLDAPLLDALHVREFFVAVETNGTIAPPAGIDWLCVSPKAGAELAVRAGDELKLVYPQAGADPVRYENLQFAHWFLQPMDGAAREANSGLAVDYCLAHPKWRLSLQTHKHLGIP